MDDMMELSDEMLENVAGGASRIINTHTDANAMVRTDPFMGAERVSSLRNGTRVNITGEIAESFEDGRIWYKIDYPVDGWICGLLFE